MPGQSDANGANPMPVTVIGEGQMGLVMADALAEGNHSVRIWGPFEDQLLELARSRESPRLPGFRLQEVIEVEPSAERALAGASLVVCAIPCQFVRGVFEKLIHAMPENVVLVSVAKGIEVSSLLRPTEVLAEVLTSRSPRTVCLSGPTIAGELARHQIATMVAAGTDDAAVAATQDAFSTDWLRVYRSQDVIGVELAGALKNVVAIAAGILDGMDAGTNAKSALLARGLAEIVRLGRVMGADQETFYGVSGVGDLATTCFSPEGRNRSCGEAIGRGVPLDQYLAESKCVVEGVATTPAIMRLIERFDLDVPILRAVNAVLFEHVCPQEAIRGLLAREAGEEVVG